LANTSRLGWTWSQFTFRTPVMLTAREFFSKYAVWQLARVFDGLPRATAGLAQQCSERTTLAAWTKINRCTIQRAAVAPHGFGGSLGGHSVCMMLKVIAPTRIGGMPFVPAGETSSMTPLPASRNLSYMIPSVSCSSIPQA